MVSRIPPSGKSSVENTDYCWAKLMLLFIIQKSDFLLELCCHRRRQGDCSIISLYILWEKGTFKSIFCTPQTIVQYTDLPSLSSLRSVQSQFWIHLIPCCCGSVTSGQSSPVVRMVAFSIDILSFGRPWLRQAATVASSVSTRTGSRPSVRETGTWNRNKGELPL